ncbi:MAG TPA: response regulator [Anaeromyxobacteraceae bacterium]|nr:response regulator [Anaeromyxobacteraceae bacterium]
MKGGETAVGQCVATGCQPIVLVVDDNEAIRENVGECLAMEGYVCWLEGSTDAALRRLQVESRSPDVVLLDLNLPGMSVDCFVSSLKKQSTWCAPIILMTGTWERDIPTGLGADALLSKPFDAGRLLEVVRDATRRAAPLRRLEPIS